MPGEYTKFDRGQDFCQRCKFAFVNAFGNTPHTGKPCPLLGGFKVMLPQENVLKNGAI